MYPTFMGTKYKNLVADIASMDNLRLAYYKTSLGKKATYGYLEFKEFSEYNLSVLREEILTSTYKQGNYWHFKVFEPKERLISALSFKDRLLQHALCNVIAPIFEKTLLPYTFACRVGMGTHAGVRHIQSLLRKHDSAYFLKTDFSKFFPSVNREVLHTLIRKKISCSGTLKILEEVIPLEGIGLPIGSLTSQLFANVYAGECDRLLHYNCNERLWARYMDDIVVLGDDLDKLKSTFRTLEEYSRDVLGMRMSKWSIAPVNRGINFLGYRIWKHHKLLRHDSVTRAKRKIKKYSSRGDKVALNKFLASWSGHAQWADAHNIKQYLERQYEITNNQHTGRP